MKTPVSRTIGAFSGLLALFWLSACAYQPPINAASYLIEDAAQTLERFAADPSLKAYRDHLAQARAVIVVPEVVEHDFEPPFTLGRAVFVARTTDGGWSDPALHDLMTTVDYDGFAYGFGGNRSLVMIVKTGPALEAILETDGRIGADHGSRIGAADDPDAEVLVFADRSLRDRIDDNLDGNRLVPNRELNEGLYGRGASRLSIFRDAYGEPATARHPAASRRLHRALGG